MVCFLIIRSSDMKWYNDCGGALRDGKFWLIVCCVCVQVLAVDLLNPTPQSEARKHKLKVRLNLESGWQHYTPMIDRGTINVYVKRSIALYKVARVLSPSFILSTTLPSSYRLWPPTMTVSGRRILPVFSLPIYTLGTRVVFLSVLVYQTNVSFRSRCLALLPIILTKLDSRFQISLLSSVN